MTHPGADMDGKSALIRMAEKEGHEFALRFIAAVWLPAVPGALLLIADEQVALMAANKAGESTLELRDSWHRADYLDKQRRVEELLAEGCAPPDVQAYVQAREAAAGNKHLAFAEKVNAAAIELESLIEKQDAESERLDEVSDIVNAMADGFESLANRRSRRLQARESRIASRMKRRNPEEKNQ